MVGTKGCNGGKATLRKSSRQDGLTSTLCGLQVATRRLKGSLIVAATWRPVSSPMLQLARRRFPLLPRTRRSYRCTLKLSVEVVDETVEAPPGVPYVYHIPPEDVMSDDESDEVIEEDHMAVDEFFPGFYPWYFVHRPGYTPWYRLGSRDDPSFWGGLYPEPTFFFDGSFSMI